ncbi:stage II sporulation protein P [Thermosyntropha lipolytica DSM 11003]|uniref:Stage II sporulation protein P n=1 Tax=Thermosyntropha lipolytica DSM 11003 TaxID=1123382 RepID=A0A1M5N6Z6_9FIRM|nr:stage II sporulation protein P [Thermosyntropha lipolytica]SHG85202.1 stage II sporulation protein P [Thermosyntropha lipolytica DSM 11003]
MRKVYWQDFIRGLLFLGVFIFVIVAAVSVDINKFYEEELAWIRWKNFIRPVSQIHISFNLGSMAFAQVNLALSPNMEPFFLNAGRKNLPAELMITTIQALAYATSGYEGKETEKIEEKASLPVQQDREQSGGISKVYYSFPPGWKAVLYCTHTSESYVLSSGKTKHEGERGLIDEVARSLAGEIRKRGLRAEYIDTIHDYPDYSQSYVKSRETVKKILQTEDKIVALFDIHRDSLPGVMKGETVEINGKKSARILIIVGTDERKPHPNWKKNLEFAKKIYSKGEEMYPGLIKGVRTKAGTYNQEFHEKALLLEFGSEYNTLEEVLYAASLFADVLITVLQEEG